MKYGLKVPEFGELEPQSKKKEKKEIICIVLHDIDKVDPDPWIFIPSGILCTYNDDDNAYDEVSAF